MIRSDFPGKPEGNYRSLSELLAPSARNLLSKNGAELMRQIGLDVIRSVILDVLSGRNLRDSTEMLTRRRIASLNIATLYAFMSGIAESDDFISQLPHLATEQLKTKRIPKADRSLAEWSLGLTEKAFQNVLRDDQSALNEYRDRYIATCDEVVAEYNALYGPLRGTLTLSSGLQAEISWLMMVYLMNTIGAQTLAVRGSEKSAYGKLFERLILGSLLSILGAKYISYPPSEFENVFWLSSRENRRESDATLLYRAGQGVRFDIGFIGRGNTEISLDKVTRFEREIALGRQKFYLATIILVDRIGTGSRIEELAQEVHGKIIQMSANYWPQQVAQVLSETVDLQHPLIGMPQSQVGTFLAQALSTIDITTFLPASIQAPRRSKKP